jgi:hypothetical protein
MFAKRLFLYLVGFFLGSVLVYILFFKDKSRSFFPSAIVLDTLQSSSMEIDKKAECVLSCYHIHASDIKEMLAEGEVNFSESSPREKPKKYVVEVETREGNELKLTFELSPSASRLISVKDPGNKLSCNCD